MKLWTIQIIYMFESTWSGRLSVIEYYLEKYRRLSVDRSTSSVTAGASALAVTACGGGGLDTQNKGFPTTYVAPIANYVAPAESDPNFEILKSAYMEPYWVKSLEMDRWDNHVTPILEDFERNIQYASL